MRGSVQGLCEGLHHVTRYSVTGWERASMQGRSITRAYIPTGAYLTDKRDRDSFLNYWTLGVELLLYYFELTFN